jgi:outer membrane immunogenic protein
MNRSLFFGIQVACVAIGVAVVGATLGTMSARAADLPNRSNPPSTYAAPTDSPFSWTGFYFGINGGYDSGWSRWSDPLVGANSGHFKPSGALAGGQVGYNWQVGSVVLGIETDADWLSVKGSKASTAGLGDVCLADGGGTCQTQQSWLGTSRGRLGYAFGRWLPYVTGGVAYGNVEAVQPTGTTTNTNIGWTAGAGLEVAIDRNWSVKLEYLHIDLGSSTFLGSASGTSTLAVPVANDLVRAGINFRF